MAVNDYYLLKYDDNLFKMASRIFGEDMVESAYVVETAYKWFSEKQLQDTTKQLNEQLYKTVKDEINNGCKDIVITFKNGKSVQLTNSEWGSISSFDVASAVMVTD